MSFWFEKKEGDKIFYRLPRRVHAGSAQTLSLQNPPGGRRCRFFPPGGMGKLKLHDLKTILDRFKD